MTTSSVRQLLSAGPSDASTMATAQMPNVLSTMPSTSATSSSTPSQPPKRLKLDAKFDVDDTCSNDAFAFNRQTQNSHQQHANALIQQQQQLKNAKLTATSVAYNGLK